MIPLPTLALVMELLSISDTIHLFWTHPIIFNGEHGNIQLVNVVIYQS